MLLLDSNLPKLSECSSVWELKQYKSISNEKEKAMFAILNVLHTAEVKLDQAQSTVMHIQYTHENSIRAGTKDKKLSESVLKMVCEHQSPSNFS